MTQGVVRNVVKNLPKSITKPASENKKRPLSKPKGTAIER
jgi:hypothetical protein